LFFNRAGVVLSILSNFTNSFNHFFNQLDEAEKQVTDETRELLVSLNEKQKEVAEHQTNIVHIEKYASDLQTFIAVKQIEKQVDTQDTCLQSLVNSDSLNSKVPVPVLSLPIGNDSIPSLLMNVTVLES
jgi:flagellar hook-associated protein FlgK